LNGPDLRSERQRTIDDFNRDLCRNDGRLALQSIGDIVGKNKWHGYILFEFDSSLAVVLECPITGNATYILTGNWRTMVTESKRRLLTEFAEHTTRLVHKGDWLIRIKRTLQQHAARTPLLKS
jgi:hypothetical protein